VWQFVTSAGYKHNTMLLVEKVGDFVQVTDTGLGSTSLDLTNVSEGDWVRVFAPVVPTAAHQLPQANLGVFRVVRIAKSPKGLWSFWIKNSSAVEDIPGECDTEFVQYDSAMPGDTLQDSTDLWGSANKGSWVISTVGSALS